jgi:class 3 adenylate cyclase
MHIANEARTHTRLVCAWGQDHSAFPIGEEFDLSVSMAVGPAIKEARVVHIADTTKDPDYLAGNLLRVRMVEEEGISTFLVVPLVRNGVAFGCINLSRRKVQPFAEDEIELIRTFAEQAVIAIENVRQFRELETRLEREAATREILEAISQSRDDEAPVFDMILGHARRLCDAPFAALVLARPGDAHQNMVAHHGAKDSTVEIYQTGGVPMDPEMSFAARAIYGQKVVHLRDMADTDEYRAGIKNVASLVDLQGIRTNLFVPLITASGGIGCFILFRHDVRPFDSNQIALVETFAAQAVIAIENVRQFRELQNRLEREAALREILEMISQSRTDPAPVFEVILRNAAHLSGAPLANLCLLNAERSHWGLVAHFGDGLRHLAIGETTTPLGSELVPAIAIRTARVVQVVDLTDTDLYRQGDPARVAMVDVEGMRTIVCVPFLSGAQAIGCITLFRREVKAYTNDEISLVETFAEQAVIAIENVRQFKALETRTAEVVALNSDLEERVEAQVSQLERLGRLRRFLSPQVADAVVSSGDDKLLGSHRAMIAILFCDIRGFTAFCESAEPEETIEVLQTFHETLGKLIHEAGAGFDHRAGDGIMVVFNDPVPCDDPAGAALRVAITMRERMVELCGNWRKMGHRMGFGVGISLGYATVGMVGFEGRFDYTASGTAVNLAARLCDQAADQEILLSARAATALDNIADVDSAGELTLKGFHAPVDAFRVTGMKETQ